MTKWPSDKIAYSSSPSGKPLILSDTCRKFPNTRSSSQATDSHSGFSEAFFDSKLNIWFISSCLLNLPRNSVTMSCEWMHESVNQSINQSMHKWIVFQATILHCKVGWGQPGPMRWIWVRIMPVVQDWLLNLLTCSPECYHCAMINPCPVNDFLVLSVFALWYLAYLCIEAMSVIRHTMLRIQFKVCEICASVWCGRGWVVWT